MTCFGPDGSHHQDGIVVTAADMAAVDFILWRSSIGTRTDRTFTLARQTAQQRGKPFAAYHFVYRTVPGAGWNAHPAEQQADTVEAALGEDRSIPVMLDWESDGSQVPTFDDCNLVAAALRARGYRVPLLYTGRWYWSQMGRPTLAGHGFDLVNANYGDQQPTDEFTMLVRYSDLGGDTSQRWDVMYGGLSPTIWQYSSRVRWGDRFMDMNAHRGPLSELGRWFWTPPPPPPPPEDEDMLTAEDLEAIRRIVWVDTQFTTTDGPKASGVVLNETRTLAQRAVRAAEAGLSEAKIQQIAAAVAARVPGVQAADIVAAIGAALTNG